MLTVQPRPRLVFAGEAIVDVALSVPEFPAAGADVMAGSSQIAAGGGFNVMAAAARQGMPVLYAGGHGTGPWGDLVRKALAAEGIDLFRGPDPSRDTGFAVGLTRVAGEGPDGERAYVTRLGAESRREPGCLDQVPVGAVDMVYISGYGLIPSGSGPVVAEWVLGLPPGALLFLDPGPLAARIPEPVLARVLPRCDWLSCTSAEADAVGHLLPRARNVIVRSGAGGCRLGPVHVPAPAVEVVDTTGAGDTHAGVFLAALARGLAPGPAAHRANAAAALSVTRPGPATAPSRAELDDWLTRNRQ